MEFNNQNGATVKNGSAKETGSKAAQQPAAAKTNGTGKHEADKPKPAPAKDETKPQPPQEEAPGKAEPRQALEKPNDEAEPSKSTLGLEGTLKAVADLHRRSIQRINLIARIRQLEAFEVALSQEHDELEENPYQGCKLIIEDDKQRSFVTTTPGLIRLVSQFIYTACHEKLAEIEATIIFPKS